MLLCALVILQVRLHVASSGHIASGVGPRRLHRGRSGERRVGQAVDGARSPRQDEATGMQGRRYMPYQLYVTL